MIVIEIFVEVVIVMGYDVKKIEVVGMVQCGGVVFLYLWFGECVLLL